MAVRRYLCSVANEIWVIGESNFQTAAQTFASEIVTMIVTSVIGTFLLNSTYPSRQDTGVRALGNISF